MRCYALPYLGMLLGKTSFVVRSNHHNQWSKSLEVSPLFTMHKLTVLMFLCLASQISARCFLGVCSDKCEDNAPTAGQCAILFDEPKCNEDKFVVPINQGVTVCGIPVSSVSFQLLGLKEIYQLMSIHNLGFEWRCRINCCTKRMHIRSLQRWKMHWRIICLYC